MAPPEWADRHPGGRELVLLHAGRECTDTFDSYHPFSNRADKILAKYAVGKLVGGSEFPVQARHGLLQGVLRARAPVL